MRPRRLFDPGWKLSLCLILAVVGINAAAVIGILFSRKGAEEAAIRELRLQTIARARSLEAAVASLRGDFIFLSQSPPLAEASMLLSSSDPVARRWSRLDIEGTLLLYLEAHPAVERLEVRDADEGVRIVAGRREGAPVLLPPRAEAASASAEGFPARTWPLSGGGRLDVTLDVATLLDTAMPEPGRRLSLRRVPQADVGEASLVSASVEDEGWDPPIRWTLVSHDDPGRLTESFARLATMYRWTIAANLIVVGFGVLLGTVALQQVRRNARLELENQHQVRMRQFERRMMHNERLASVGRLAANLAHEIGNPLEGMSNYLGALEDDLAAGDSEAAADMVGRIREGLDRAEGTLRQVLTLSDPAGAARSPVRLESVIEETVGFLHSHVSLNRIELRWRPPDVELPVSGNRITLGQLFLNLILNACESQPDGGTVDVLARRDGGLAVVEVADRGPGIPPDVLSRIFEPFFSTRDSSGLGLSISQGIVTHHEGVIAAENVAEGGALFRVELPLLTTENRRGVEVVAGLPRHALRESTLGSPGLGER